MKTSKPIALATLVLAAAFLSVPARAEIRDTTALSKRVDKLVDAVLAEKKVEPNGPISDELFLRRIYLAVIGRIPTGEESEAFLTSKAGDKRDRLIDRLLESEGYVSHFYNFWADVLRINTRLGRSGASNEYAYKHWVKENLRSNRPYDQMVYDLIAADGNVWENGATGYYHRDRGMPLDNMANTVRVFLGTRLECAQCHDHPFDKWKQTDFFHMASFTYGVRAGYAAGDNREAIRSMMSDERKERIRKVAEEVSGIKGFYPQRRDSDIDKLYASDDRRNVSRRLGIKTAEEYKAINKKVTAALSKSEREDRVVSQLMNDIYNPLRYASMSNRDRNSQLPHDYQYDDAKPNQAMPPGTMFGEAVDKDALKDGYMPAYAKWMTSKSNPRFARVIANRLWKKAFGLGLVEPVDQFMEQTQAQNPALMDYLETAIKDLDFDMKSFLAMLFKSEAWQRAAHAEEVGPGADFYFPGPIVQRMSAEQIWDSFATLVIPDPDHYQPSLARELQTIEKDRKIYEALESRKPEEFKAMIDELTAEVKASYARQEVVRAKYLKARKDEDDELKRTYSAELRKLTSDMRRQISKVAYNGADGRTRDMGALMAEAGMVQMDAEGEADGERYVRSSLPRIKLEMPENLSKQEQKAWTAKQRELSSAWARIVRDVMRASELPTPAPRGHFLREFGQSDRELIENASDAASVPQALNLMNSGVSDMLRHPHSVLGQALDKCATPEEEISTLYRLMLTRVPTPAETERLLREYKSDPKRARNNAIWALVNTQQFIFSL
ncbi:MAG: DUF1549 domain-containing protein [Verrucomicrobiae bacterium]|nr:DUF1549 domain-containing protein [Verrucomicrobiae bacterium]